MTTSNCCGGTCSPATTDVPAKVASDETARVFSPRVDIREVADGIELTADLPGVAEQDLELLLEKHVLTIRGKVAPLPEGAEPVYQEYGVGNYERVFTLPTDIDLDRIAARLQQGVLRLHLPRVTPPGARRIAVATSA